MPKSDAYNLLEILQKYEASVLLFAKNALVPFTNNRGERDLRMSTVKQKVSRGLHSAFYTHDFLLHQPLSENCGSQGGLIIAIQMALVGTK